MDSEKMKEIKNCLVFCKNRLCEFCPRLKQEPNQEEDCRLALIGQSLTLINELEGENKWLSSKYRNLEINYNDAWEQYREYEVENKQLKNRIAELVKENEILKGTKDRLTFADRIKLVDNAVEKKLKELKDAD